MKRYSIRFSVEVKMDIKGLFNKIAYDYKRPMAAARYRNGLLNAIRQLPTYAGSIAFSRYEYIQSRYGPHARHITYKKMTIIYTIINNTVLIKRVIPSKLIR
jgi:plasmid stabilization system protein ParE